MWWTGFCRRTVDQLAHAALMVQVMDTPVPQMVEQLLEVLRRLDIEVPVQVIEVPKISQDCIRERLADCDLRHPQMAEQLMEVPTVLSLALLQQQYAEQIVDNPASRGRGLRGGIQSFFPGQSSTAAVVDIPVPRGDLQGFLPGQGSTASSSHSPVAADEAGQGFFAERRRRVQEEAAEAMNQARLFLEQAAKRRKKKKRKKRVPRTSSHSSCGRARRRQRQWHARSAGFPGDDPPRAVFPSSVGLPELPGILVGVFQKDSGVLFVDSGSGMSQAGFADISPRAVFLSIVAWPLMLRILAGMDQKDRCSGIYKAGLEGDNTPRAVFSSLVGRPRMLVILADMDQKDSYALGSSMFKAGIAIYNAPRAVFTLFAGP